jgi:hypothetical protein
MIVRFEFSIDDTMWPKLSLSGTRITTTGERVAFNEKQQYDLAYGAFENAIHNQLRPAVEEIIRRHVR